MCDTRLTAITKQENNMPKLNLVAVINGTDYPAEYELHGSGNMQSWFKQAAEDAVRKAGIKNERTNPMQMGVEVFILKIKGTELVRERVGKILVTPPLKPMTDTEYQAELTTILATVPKEFHHFVSTNAWDHGHSSGYEEVINIASQLASDLQPAITEYTKSIKGKS